MRVCSTDETQPQLLGDHTLADPIACHPENHIHQVSGRKLFESDESQMILPSGVVNLNFVGKLLESSEKSFLRVVNNSSKRPKINLLEAILEIRRIYNY